MFMPHEAKCLSSNVLHGICQETAAAAAASHQIDDVAQFGLTHARATRQTSIGLVNFCTHIAYIACVRQFVPLMYYIDCGRVPRRLCSERTGARWCVPLKSSPHLYLGTQQCVAFRVRARASALALRRAVAVFALSSRRRVRARARLKVVGPHSAPVHSTIASLANSRHPTPNATHRDQLTHTPRMGVFVLNNSTSSSGKVPPRSPCKALTRHRSASDEWPVVSRSCRLHLFDGY